MIWFAVDPGTTQSGWVLFDGTKILDSGVHDNHDLRRWIEAGQGADRFAIETFQAMGMAVGKEVFETCIWVGRFIECWREPDQVRRVYRSQVKQFLCRSARAKDANIRQALIDLIGPTGTKRQPGPTYGVSSHAWSALAVAVTAAAMESPAAIAPGLFAPVHAAAATPDNFADLPF